MPYIQDTLLDNEKIIYQERLHWVIFFYSGLFFIAANIFYWDIIFIDVTSTIEGISLQSWIAIAFLAIAVFQFFGAYIAYVTAEFGVTNRRILMKMGWLRRISIELFLDKVEAILVDQSLLGRILGYGRVVVVGTGGSRDPFTFIARPLQFRRAVQQQIDVFNHSAS